MNLETEKNSLNKTLHSLEQDLNSFNSENQNLEKTISFHQTHLREQILKTKTLKQDLLDFDLKRKKFSNNTLRFIDNLDVGSENMGLGENAFKD